MVVQRFDSVPDYIASFPPATQTKLKQVRKAIRDAVPGAEESISYHMPSYTLGAWKLYFSGYTSHISLHGSVEVARPLVGAEMAEYEASGRGTLKFPLDAPMPVKLIAAIAKAGIAEKGGSAAAAGRPGKRAATRKAKGAAKRPGKRAAKRSAGSRAKS